MGYTTFWFVSIPLIWINTHHTKRPLYSIIYIVLFFERLVYNLYQWYCVQKRQFHASFLLLPFLKLEILLLKWKGFYCRLIGHLTIINRSKKGSCFLLFFNGSWPLWRETKNPDRIRVLLLRFLFFHKLNFSSAWEPDAGIRAAQFRPLQLAVVALDEDRHRSSHEFIPARLPEARFQRRVLWNSTWLGVAREPVSAKLLTVVWAERNQSPDRYEICFVKFWRWDFWKINGSSTTAAEFHGFFSSTPWSTAEELQVLSSNTRASKRVL